MSLESDEWEEKQQQEIKKRRQQRADIRKGKNIQLFMLLCWFVLALIVVVVLLAVDEYSRAGLGRLNQFWGKPIVFSIGVLLIFLVGIVLYQLRQNFRLLYSLIEITFALAYGGNAIQSFGTDRGSTETITFLAAIYLIVRGADNFAIGWKERQEQR